MIQKSCIRIPLKANTNVFPMMGHPIVYPAGGSFEQADLCLLTRLYRDTQRGL